MDDKCDFDIREPALLALKLCEENSDQQVAHEEADEILCGVLRKLGYGEIVDAWEEVDKWHA